MEIFEIFPKFKILLRHYLLTRSPVTAWCHKFNSGRVLFTLNRKSYHYGLKHICMRPFSNRDSLHPPLLLCEPHFSLATGLDRLITHNGERSIIVVYIHALLFPTFHFPECFLLRARVELKIEWIVEIFSIYFPSRHKKFSERSMNELKFVLPPEVCCDREVKDASKMNISIKKSALTSLPYTCTWTQINWWASFKKKIKLSIYDSPICTELSSSPSYFIIYSLLQQR